MADGVNWNYQGIWLSQNMAVIIQNVRIARDRLLLCEQKICWT